jgi:hypothetical protein
VFFNARNGRWIQDLILKKSNKSAGLLSATKVGRGLVNDKITAYEDIAPGFVEEFGSPDWKS